MKILVVDDDLYIQQLVAIHLGKEGYTVLQADHAEQALLLLENETVDLAIVDVMMPGMNGFELTRILTQDLDIPVILLTAKGQLEDKEKGFLSGTEDYMVKPFEPKELLFRVAVVLRRSERAVQEHLQAGNLSINRRNFEVAIGNETLILPLKEFELLSLLVSRANLATPRTLLMDYVWGEEHEGNEMTLNTHINRIRDRLKRHGANVEIQTLRGIGYKLEVSK
ncbi:response regulator transcription factor [Planococcus sp. N028]|uniref:Heme response regulator HssR n=1 Tax=Planococcus shixiaomingii TaxID=3058393 RepID=A0ABT8N4U1_9BACL|nr:MULTISPECIES: response regulator transcription factor [unclassified Planococcus (in: firmicutes)]MDN7242896.1 response regulator transcription factor [Planococcus sp. N028]WKA56700.1 response regulator transcription factor [Planococcus sp. N022]